VDDGELAATTSARSVFQMCEAASAKARLPTVDSLTGGTTRWLALVERNFFTYKMCIVLEASCCLQYITRPTSQPISICMILHLQNNSKHTKSQTHTSDAAATTAHPECSCLTGVRRAGVLTCGSCHLERSARPHPHRG